MSILWLTISLFVVYKMKEASAAIFTILKNNVSQNMVIVVNNKHNIKALLIFGASKQIYTSSWNPKFLNKTFTGPHFLGNLRFVSFQSSNIVVVFSKFGSSISKCLTKEREDKFL